MKIDVTKIEGYDSMTAEEKITALEALEMPDPDYSGYVKKDVFDKAAAETAEWKRKHNALLTDEEKKKAERDEELEKLRNAVADMKLEKKISGLKANFIAMGYDEKLASKAAEATANGDTEAVLAAQKKFMEDHDKALKADLMKDTPTPEGSADGGSSEEKSRAAEIAKAYHEQLYGKAKEE